MCCSYSISTTTKRFSSRVTICIPVMRVKNLDIGSDHSRGAARCDKATHGVVRRRRRRALAGDARSGEGGGRRLACEDEGAGRGGSERGRLLWWLAAVRRAARAALRRSTSEERAARGRWSGAGFGGTTRAPSGPRSSPGRACCGPGGPRGGRGGQRGSGAPTPVRRLPPAAYTRGGAASASSGRRPSVGKMEVRKGMVC